VADTCSCAGKILDIPIYNTTQNAARLGATVREIADNFPEGVVTVDKTAFSMLVPEVTSKLLKQASSMSTPPSPEPLTILLVGIESHICITQTTLDLLQLGHKVYVLADGVSSCNEGERGIAFARLRAEGATVTTSESVLFELVGDAGDKNFKAISGLVRDTKDGTKQAVSTLCSRL